jgi:hypothetical protein
MNVPFPVEDSSTPRVSEPFVPRRLAMRVGGHACAVRVTPICSIEEILGFDGELQAAASGGCGQELCGPAGEAAVLAELFDAQMIAPPRPRRRRDRAVSSRAVFYAAADG